MQDKNPPRAIFEAGLYFTSLILNIFLGWVVTKFNTSYLDLVEYGRYSFFIIILFLIINRILYSGPDIIGTRI